MTQSALSKERRELREQQQRTALEAIPKDLSRPWEDPLPEPGERHLAQVSDKVPKGVLSLVGMPSIQRASAEMLAVIQANVCRSFLAPETFSVK